MKFDALLKLAQGNVQKDEFYVSEEYVSSEIKNALNELKVEDRKQMIKDAALQIMEVLKKATKEEKALVDLIRESRRIEGVCKAKLAKIKLAKEQANETDNYLPLLSMIDGLAMINGLAVYQISREHPELFELKKPVVKSVEAAPIMTPAQQASAALELYQQPI